MRFRTMPSRSGLVRLAVKVLFARCICSSTRSVRTAAASARCRADSTASRSALTFRLHLLHPTLEFHSGHLQEPNSSVRTTDPMLAELVPDELRHPGEKFTGPILHGLVHADDDIGQFVERCRVVIHCVLLRDVEVRCAQGHHGIFEMAPCLYKPLRALLTRTCWHHDLKPGN